MASKFLDNTEDSDYKRIAENMLTYFQVLGCRKSLKAHFYMHTEYFLESPGDLMEENDERFHQKMKTMEAMHLERWDVTMMANYCWYPRSNFESSLAARKSNRKKFIKHTFKDNRMSFE